MWSGGTKGSSTLGCGQEALKAVTQWGVDGILELGCSQQALKTVALTGGPTGTGVWPGGTEGSSTYWWPYWDWGVARRH